MEDLIKEFGAKVDALKGEVVSKNDFDALKTELESIKETGATAEQLKSIEAQLKELKDANVTNSLEEVKSMREQIKEQILANFDDFGKLKTEKSASFGLVIKAPADMLISTNTTGRIARQDREAGTNRIVRRRPFVLDNVTVSPTNGNTVYWVDQANPDGTPAMTAEGATKAQID